MKIIFDSKKLEDVDLEEVPIAIDFGIKTINIKTTDFLGFVEDLVEGTYDLDEKNVSEVEIYTDKGIIKLNIIKKNNEEIEIYLNGNLIEKTDFKRFMLELNCFFADLIQYLKKLILEEIKENGTEIPYVIVLGKIYEWQEDFYEFITDSSID